MSVREARIMNVRAFRAELPDEKVIVLRPDGSVRGSWTPGTEGIDPEALAQAMGLVADLKARIAPVKPTTVTVSPTGTTTVGPLAKPTFRPVPKPQGRKK